MLEWSLGVVHEVSAPAGGVQEAKVRLTDGTMESAVYYIGEGNKDELSIGDRVLLNTTAMSLKLGTGGIHFIHAVLPAAPTAASFPADRTMLNKSADRDDGHIMKLRYTSLQRSVLSVEEPASPYHELFKQQLTLNGMPVLVGELHSMLPAVLCRLQQLIQREGCRCKIAYIMSEGGALPMAFSSHVRQLRQLDWLAGTVTYGQAYGGDVEAVNKYTALLAAKHVLKADIAIVLMGPGAVGTGTQLGFSGIEAGELINAAASLDGVPILIPRISFQDSRVRHYGLSHHLITVLSTVAYAEACVPLPKLEGAQERRLREQLEPIRMKAAHRLCWHEPVPVSDWEQALVLYPMPISSMGKELREDPGCLAGIGAAADEAWHCWQNQRS